MKYNYKKDYKHIFDTPAKMEQERVVVVKIMELLNKNKYDNIYDFINKNQTYQDFLKNNELTNVVKHFGNTLTEEDFKNIQAQIVKITEQKKQNDKGNVKTTTIDSQQFVSYESKDKTYFFDNTHNPMTMERQLDELQQTQSDFQTTDSKQNTISMMEQLEKNTKESLNLNYIYQIDINKLNSNEKEIFDAVVNYQLSNPNPIRVDLQRGIIVTEDNEILKVEKINGEFSIVYDGNKKENINDQNDISQTKTFQKTLKPSGNTIYSANN